MRSWSIDMAKLQWHHPKVIILVEFSYQELITILHSFSFGASHFSLWKAPVPADQLEAALRQALGLEVRNLDGKWFEKNHFSICTKNQLEGVSYMLNAVRDFRDLIRGCRCNKMDGTRFSWCFFLPIWSRISCLAQENSTADVRLVPAVLPLPGLECYINIQRRAEELAQVWQVGSNLVALSSS